MQSWLSKIIALLTNREQSIYKEFLFNRSIKVMVIQFIGLALTFSGNILLARIYGDQVYGIYSLVTSWAVFIAVIALWGMDDSHLVNLPTYKLKKDSGNIRRQWNWSVRLNLVGCTICIVATYILLHFFNIEGLSEHANDFNFGLVLICLLTFYNNLLSFLRGMDLVIAGEILDKLFRPAGFLVFLLLFYYMWPGISPGPPLLANNLVVFIVFTTGLFLIIPMVNAAGNSSVSSGHFSFRANTRYVLLNLLYLLSTRLDILLLGILSFPILVGHYNVATKFADVFAYPIAIINLSLPTLLARERHEKGAESKPAVMLVIARNSFLQCLFLAVLFLLTGHWFLAWYGQGFVDAFPALSLLILSNLISAGTGSIDVFFIMHAQEKKAIYCRIASLATSLVAALILIRSYGMTGAALAMLAGNVVYCFLLELFFYKKYGMVVHPFLFKSHR